MIYWIALSLVEGIGLTTKHKLLESFDSPDKIFEQKISKKDFLRMRNDIDFRKIKDNCLRSAERIINFCEREKVEAVCFDDENYPQSLKKISDPPLLLYCKGDKKTLSQKSVAIVGTREPNENGIKDTRTFSSGLARGGYLIVSGLARGVDSIAHQSAMESGGKTIAVMATGINEISPVSNIALSRRIVESSGALITEQVPGKLPFAPNFVMRNRIISALSNCCIIVSAPEKSGALATAKFAEQQNKKVFIIPGTISDEKYRGSNKLLLKKNFDPALAVDDILEYLGGKKSVEQLDMFYIPAPQKNNNTDLPKEQQNLLSFFNDKPLSLEELSQKSNIDISELADILFDLELNGSVIQDIAGNYYLP